MEKTDLRKKEIKDVSMETKADWEENQRGEAASHEKNKKYKKSRFTFSHPP